jgi:hypothetical protein
VLELTLRGQHAGKRARRDCLPSSKKLSEIEEEVIVNHLLELDQREYAPTDAFVRDIDDASSLANKDFAYRLEGKISLVEVEK